MKRVLASSAPLALVLTLLVSTVSRGQQQAGNHPGQPGQGQAGQQGNPAQQPGMSPPQGGNPNQSGQQQPGQPANPAQSGRNQPGQSGNPIQAAQPQHNDRQGQPGQDPWANHQAGYWDLGVQGDLGYPSWSEIANGKGMVFAFVDNASRNSGMTLAPADPALRAQLKLRDNEGLIVTQVEPGSPAAAAGIHQNDLLVRMEQSSGSFTSLGNVQELVDALKNRGEQVARLVLMRAGRQVTITVQPRVHASLGPIRPEPPTYWIGVAVSPVEPALRAQLQLPDNQGLIVVEVDPQSPAAKAGVHKFDIIRSVNGFTPSDPAALTRMIQAHGDRTVVIELTREARPVHVELAPVRRHALGRRLSAEHPAQTLYRVNLIGGQKGTMLGNMALDPNGNLVGNVVADYFPQKVDSQFDLALTKRLDDLTAQIRELRQAVEAMTKAQAQGQGNR